MKALTIPEVAEKLAGTLGVSKAQALATWKDVCSFIQAEADAGNEIRLGELGVVYRKELPAGTARVPGSDREVEVGARYTYKLRKRPQAIEA